MTYMQISFVLHNNAARKLLHFIDEKTETGRCSVICPECSGQARIWLWTASSKPAIAPPAPHILAWVSVLNPRQQQLSLCHLISPATQDMASLQESGEMCLEGAASLLSSNAADSKAHKCLPPWAGNFAGPDEVRKRSHECGGRIIFVKPVPAEALGLEKSTGHSHTFYTSTLTCLPSLKSTTHF